MINVLFVCLGNICRSPTAEAVFRDLVRQSGLSDEISVDSAGTADFHLGKPPDPRAHATARRRGVAMDELRARQVEPEDFHRFDYIVAMDTSILDHLTARRPPESRARLALLLDFAPTTGRGDVPDPYHETDDAFEHVFKLVETGARGLFNHIRAGLS